jgi:hypothetical protein
MEIWFRGFSSLDFKADDFPIQVTLKKLRDAEFFQEICSWISVSCKRRSVIALTVSFCCLRCCVPLVGFYELDIDVLGIQRWFFFHYKYSLPLCFPGNAFSLYNYKY